MKPAIAYLQPCFGVLALCLAASTGPAVADAPRSAEAVPLMLKSLTFDRNFAARGQLGAFVILVPAEAPRESARNALIDSLRRLGELKAGRRPVTLVPVELKDEAALDAAVQQHRAGAILAVPGTTPAGVKAIAEVSMDNQIYSLGLEEGMADQGMALCIAEHDGHLQPVVNVTAAQAVGAVFELSLLKLARLVK